MYVIRQILLTALSEEREGPECFLVRLQCVKTREQKRACRCSGAKIGSLGLKRKPRVADLAQISEGDRESLRHVKDVSDVPLEKKCLLNDLIQFSCFNFEKSKNPRI